MVRRIMSQPERKLVAAARTRERRQKTIDWFNSVKASGCVICGEKDVICLGFHHRDPSTKLFDIATKKTGAKAGLAAEIAKCDVICANCHLKEHARLRKQS